MLRFVPCHFFCDAFWRTGAPLYHLELDTGIEILISVMLRMSSRELCVDAGILFL